jgi:hypothetical protein
MALGIGTTTMCRRIAQSRLRKQRPERAAKRQNATWRHSRCGRNQRRQRSKFRRSSCSIAELGFTIVLAVIASKVVGVLAYGLRRRAKTSADEVIE